MPQGCNQQNSGNEKQAINNNFFFPKKDERKKKDEEIKRNINNSQTCLNPKFEQYKIKMTGEMWIK